jgi:recombination endonuclease VII
MFKSKKVENEWKREWRKKNSDKVKAAQKKYYQANKEKRIANTRKWEEDNPERVLAKRRKRQPKIKEWKKNNPDKVRAGYRRQRYGVTPEHYDQMVEDQDNKCAICGKPETVVDYRTGKLRSLSVDHDHDTNTPRQLLCRRCNSGIGMFEDNIKLLEVAIQYLRKHEELSEKRTRHGRTNKAATSESR